MSKRTAERAGSSASSLPRCLPSFPRALAVAVFVCALSGPVQAGPLGAAGDLYVSGFSSNNIVQFDGQTGAFVGEFVPAGAGGLCNPAGLAFGPNGNLFVCNFCPSFGNPANAAILEFNGETGEFIGMAIAGEDGTNPAAGWLHTPTSLLFTPDGRLLVASSSDESVQAYDATTYEWLGTFAIGGPSPGGLGTASGIGLASDGTTYVSGGIINDDEKTGKIRGYHSVTGRFKRTVIAGLDSSIRGLDFDAQGKMWVVTHWGDTETHSTGKLLQIEPDTGSVVSSNDVVKPRGLILAPWGNVLVAHQNEILEFSGETGQLIGQFAFGPLTNAEGMAFKPFPPDAMPAPSVAGISAGNLNACDGDVSVTVTGTNLDPAQTTVLLTATGEPGIAGVITGGDSTELTVSFGLGAGIAGGPRDVVVTNPDGQSATLAKAIDVAPCHAGRESNLFVLGSRHRATKTRYGLFEYDGETGDVIGFVVEDSSGSDLAGSRGFLFSHDGNLLITSNNPGAGSVLVYDGVIGRKIGTHVPAGSGGMLRPHRLTFGPNSNLFVLHKGVQGSPSGVLEFDGLTGTLIRDFVPLESCGLLRASDFEFRSDGNLYITEATPTGENYVYVFDGQTGECLGDEPLAITPGEAGISIGSLGFTSQGQLVLPWSSPSVDGSLITEHNPENGVLLNAPIQPPAGGLYLAGASVFGPNGNLYVAGYPDLIFQYDLAEGATLGLFAGQGTGSGQNASASEIAFQPLFGDANGDWALDLRDFARLQGCFGGDGVLPADVNCLKLDYDRDGDVDAADGSAFVERMTGPQ